MKEISILDGWNEEISILDDWNGEILFLDDWNDEISGSGMDVLGWLEWRNLDPRMDLG